MSATERSDWRVWTASAGVLPVSDGDVLLARCEVGPSGADADPVPLVLLHGFAGSTADWDDVAPELGADRRVVAYDHRGHGGSSHVAGPDAYTFDRLVADCADVVPQVAAGPVDLVGHSMGGIVALRYALDHPARVRSLVLVNTAPEPAASPVLRLLFAGLTALVARRGLGPVLRFIRRTVRVPEGASEQQAARLERQGAAFAGMDPAAFVAYGRAIRRHPSLRKRLGELRCPVTVVNGARDTAVRSAARQFVRATADCRVVVLPGAGHSPQTEQPAAWVAAVREHVARCTGDVRPTP